MHLYLKANPVILEKTIILPWPGVGNSRPFILSAADDAPLAELLVGRPELWLLAAPPRVTLWGVGMRELMSEDELRDEPNGTRRYR